MKRLVAIAALLAVPALAEDAPKSEAGTAFIERCLADVSAHRIANLKTQAPEYAASLSDDELLAGGMVKARTACPCFLQIAAVDPESPGEPEDKVARIVAYLDALGSDVPLPMPPTIPRLTRMCGERSSILPPTWIGQ